MLSSNVVFAYFSTADRFHRLARSIEVQQKFGPQISRESFLIVDCIPESMPESVRQFFQDRIHVVDAYVTDEHNHRAVCLPKLRNAAIRIARESAATWMFFCDADTVIPRFVLPGRGIKFAFPYVYWQKSLEETLAESLATIESRGSAAFSEGNSWFMLHRDVFEQIDFNENIIGYGWEDLEFSDRVLAKGMPRGSFDTHVLHLFHSQEEREVHWWQFYRNEAIFESTRLALDRKYNPDWKQTEVKAIASPDLRGHLCLDHAHRIVIDPARKILGTFALSGELVTIRWEDSPSETYRRTGVFLERLNQGEHEDDIAGSAS